MEKNQKMIVGAIAIIVLVGLIGAFVFSQPTGIALNISNNSSEQGASSQGSGSQDTSSQSGSQGSGTSVGSSSSGSSDSQYVTCTKCGGTGSVEDTVWTKEKCDVCGGSGTLLLNGRKVSCPYCDGGYNLVPNTYKKTCDACGGTGKVQA